MLNPFEIRVVIVNPSRDLELMPQTAILIDEIFPNVEKVTDEFTGSGAIDRLVSWATEPVPPHLPKIPKKFLVITEYNLPDMTCEELIYKIRFNQVLRNSFATLVYTVVADSVYDESRLSSVDSCGGLYVVKPVHRESLELIREAILPAERETIMSRL